MSPRRAFTLIEVLVVVAVLSIVAAILFPAFVRARDRARASACLSNVRQIGMGVLMYAQDFDETLPTLGTVSEGRGRWMWQIRSYTRSLDIFTCPNTPMNRYDGAPYSDKTSYGWSGVLQASSGELTPEAMGFKLSAIMKPAETLVLGETGYDDAPGWAMYARSPLRCPNSDSRPGYWPQFRHQAVSSRVVTDLEFNQPRSLPVEGRGSFFFLDGHARSLSLQDAFKEADEEEGFRLDSVEESERNQSRTTRYVYWNII